MWKPTNGERVSANRIAHIHSMRWAAHTKLAISPVCVLHVSSFHARTSEIVFVEIKYRDSKGSS